MTDIYQNGWVSLSLDNYLEWVTEVEGGIRWHTLHPEDLTALVHAASEVLYHDERGQGLGYSEAMNAMKAALEKIKGV